MRSLFWVLFIGPYAILAAPVSIKRSGVITFDGEQQMPATMSVEVERECRHKGQTPYMDDILGPTCSMNPPLTRKSPQLTSQYGPHKKREETHQNRSMSLEAEAACRHQGMTPGVVDGSAVCTMGEDLTRGTPDIYTPADSRLLVNLISHEKDYSKHLQALFDPSHASLSAFTAYASASAPPLSNTIIAVASSLAAADDAMARYADTVDQYREHLNHVKSLEDDVANIYRDREILVTRLIKASKSHKPTKPTSSSSLNTNRNSLHLISPNHPSSSTSSLNSGFTSPSQTLPISSALPTSAKLSSAQAELQACEAQLATKERQLAIERVNALKEGLSLRLKGLIDCGWVWGEAGKKALGALDSLSDEMNDAALDKPLPPLLFSGNYGPPDDVSSASNSLAPSQSASQAGDHSLYIPPAHAISESNPFPSRHVLSRRITEEELSHFPTEDQAEPASSHPNLTLNKEEAEEDGGSSADEAQPEAEQLQIVENPRFATPPKRKKSTKQKPEVLFAGDSPAPQTASSMSPPLSPSAKSGIFRRRFSIRQPQQPSPGSVTSLPVRPASPSGSPLRGRGAHREGSVHSAGGASGFFGSIRGLFFGRHDGAHPRRGMAVYDPPAIDGLPASSSDGIFAGNAKSKEKWKGKKWEMDRTEKNLKNLKNGDRESDDDDAGTGVVLSGLPATAPTRSVSLKKRRRVASDTGVGVGIVGSSTAATAGAGIEASKSTKHIVSASTSHLPQPESQLSQTPQRASSPPAAGRKLKKTKVRSASVPPSSSGAQDHRATSPETRMTGADTDTLPVSTLNGGAQAKRRVSLARRPSRKGKEKEEAGGDENVSNVPIKEGIKEGFTVTVVGSSEPSTSTSTDGLPSGSVSSPVSRRSSTSAKTGNKTHTQRNALDPEKRMMSLLSAVADGDKNTGKGTDENKEGGTKERDQVSKGKDRESAIPKAPDSVLESIRGRSDATPEANAPKEPEKEKANKEQEESPRSSLSLPRSPPTLLKSALRNSSRTPSPLPPLPPATILAQPTSEPESRAILDPEAPGESVPIPDEDLDDAASMSSYETGHEVFFEPDPNGIDGDAEDQDTVRTNSTVTPVTATATLPVVEGAPSTTNGSAVPGHSPESSSDPKREKDLRSAQASGSGSHKETESDDRPPTEHKRRKSVRVSLQPTFSPTPPAIEYEDENDVWSGPTGRDVEAGKVNEAWWNDSRSSPGHRGGQEKISKGKAGKRKQTEEKDVWEDSSEEDEEYARARRLLSRSVSPTRVHAAK